MALSLDESGQAYRGLFDAIEFLELALFAFRGLLETAELARLGCEPVRNASQHLADLGLELADFTVNSLRLDRRGYLDRLFRFSLFKLAFRRQFGGALFVKLPGQGLVSLQHLLLRVLFGELLRGCDFFRHNSYSQCCGSAFQSAAIIVLLKSRPEKQNLR